MTRPAPQNDKDSRQSSGKSAEAQVTGLAAEIGKKKPFDLAEEELFLNLMRANEHASIPVDRLIKSFGLTDAQYNALRILRGHGGGPIASGIIAEQMVSREPDISRLLTRIEALGYIERERDSDDRRVVLVSLTPEGRRRVDALDKPLRAMHREQFAHLTPSEIESLNTLLSRLRRKA